MAETFEQLNKRIGKSVSKSVKEFNKLIQEYAEKAPKAAVVQLQRVMVLEGIRRLIFKTPVDTGKARGGWQTQLGKGTEGDVARLDKSGEQAIAEAGKVAASIKDFVLVTIFNNTPYIVPLENGNSKQAPRGMLRVTLQELKQVFP